MANEVYANGMELACKAGAGKTICAFPDVCFTPPENPATPPGVPVPYPNTGFASDTTNGSKTVKISGKEVMLKNKSYFKKSTGDEAGCAAKKGVISSTNTGKVYFVKWSMDVKFEGENVDRHLDLTTHNHASPMANEAMPWPFTDGMIIPSTDEACKELSSDMNKERKQLSDQMNRIFEGSPCGERIKDGKIVARKPATLAVGMITDGGGKVRSHSMVAHNKIKKGKKYRKYSKGIKRRAQSNVTECSGSGKNEGKKFKYKSNPKRPYQGHAEAKIIEAWFRQGGKGKLLLNVSRPVCEECARLIRAVNCAPDGKRNCNKIKVCADRQDDESIERLKC
jgi:hypothetical protein